MIGDPSEHSGGAAAAIESAILRGSLIKDLAAGVASSGATAAQVQQAGPGAAVGATGSDASHALMSIMDARMRGPVQECGQAAADLLLRLPWAAGADAGRLPRQQQALRRAASALLGGIASLEAAQARLCSEVAVARAEMYYGEKEPDEAALFGYSPSMARYMFFFCLDRLCSAVLRAARAEVEALTEDHPGAVAAAVAEAAVAASAAASGPAGGSAAAAAASASGGGMLGVDMAAAANPAAASRSTAAAAAPLTGRAQPAPAAPLWKRALRAVKAAVKTNPGRFKYAFKVASVRPPPLITLAPAQCMAPRPHHHFTAPAL